jgi:ferritin-like protein
MTKPNHHNIPPSDMESVSQKWQRVVGRRSFLHGVGVAGATLAATTLAAQGSNKLPPGDVAILRFLAAAELIESDLWSQYAELGGANGGNPAYKLALQNLDGDMPQYITDNTDDELSHAAFLNAYLMSKGAQPVNLDMFRTLPSTIATGAKQIKRLTNLQQLDVDTSYYTRYRSDLNPDLGAMFPDVVSIKNQPAIPISDADTPPGQAQPVPPTTTQQTRMQAIANSAAFHFGFIEQGGSSLYPTMALKATDLEVLRIVLSIGGVEIDHFSLWHDKLGNAISQPLAGVVDPETGTAFPDLNNPMNQPFGNDLAQTNLILPEPCQFIDTNFPLCSVIRPISTENSGAMAAVKALTADNLFNFTLQPGFFDTLMERAAAADAAMRQSGHN